MLHLFDISSLGLTLHPMFQDNHQATVISLPMPHLWHEKAMVAAQPEFVDDNCGFMILEQKPM